LYVVVQSETELPLQVVDGFIESGMNPQRILWELSIVTNRFGATPVVRNSGC